MEEAPRPGMAPARLQGCNAPQGVRTLPLQPPACALLISEGWLRDAGRNALSLPTRAGGSFPVLQHSNHHHCAGDTRRPARHALLVCRLGAGFLQEEGLAGKPASGYGGRAAGRPGRGGAARRGPVGAGVAEARRPAHPADRALKCCACRQGQGRPSCKRKAQAPGATRRLRRLHWLTGACCGALGGASVVIWLAECASLHHRLLHFKMDHLATHKAH